MNGARTFTYIFGLVFILTVLPTVVPAQGLSAGTGYAPARANLGYAAPGSLLNSSDLFFGRDTKGPYLLSWKPIERLSEQVFFNDNEVIQQGLDYEIDYALGTLTFHALVRSSTIVRIEYRYDPSKAVPNKAPANVPLTLDLLKRADAGLQFTALYKSSDPEAKSIQDMAIYGLTGSTKTEEGEFSSMFLMSPAQSAVPGQESASFGERSALKLGGSTKTDKLQVSTSYLKVGEQFAGAKEYKLQQGLEAMDMSAAFTPTSSLSLSSSYKSSDYDTGEKKGESSRIAEHVMTYSPEGAPKLTVARTEVDKEREGAEGQKVTTDKLQLEHTLSPRISAVASHEKVATDVGDSESRLTTNQLAIDAKPKDNLAIQSRLTQKSSSTEGDETGIGLNVQAMPGKSLSVQAAMSRVDADKTGKTAAESFKLAANPNKLLNVEMSVAHKDTDAAGDELVHAVKVVSAPTDTVQLELGMTGRNVEQPEDESARTAKLSTTALKNTTVQLDWAQKDSDVSGGEEFQGVKVETKPLETVKLSGALSRRERVDARDLSKEARVEVRPFGHTTVGGAYKEVETNGSVVARVTEVSASTKPVGAVEFSGAYRSRENVGQEDLDSMNMALILDTGSMVKFTGAYATNPEDKEGVVQRMNSQSFGLKSDFGRLKVRGAYTLKDEYLAGKRSEQKEVGLDYRLSSKSLLTTRYAIDEYREASLLQTSVYALEYSHRVGRSLNLYLSGRMTTYERDSVMMKDQTEYEAEARLGVRF